MSSATPATEASAALPTIDPNDPWLGLNPAERSPELRANPFPRINAAREAYPVHQTPIGYWRILRHDDVVRVLRELPCGVRTTDGKLPGVDESVLPRRFMLMQDPPDHTRLRRLVSHAFTPPAIERLRADVAVLCEELIDRVAGTGEMDVIADLARPVPSTVICQMLGVPLEDRVRFTDWTAQVTHLLALDSLPKSQHEVAFGAAMSLAQYMNELIEQRRRNPGDDMLSTLIAAEEQGDRLSPEELLAQSVGLLVAGFETTIGLIGNGVRQLLLHPDQLAKLRARPELIESAVEECLRFDGPIQATRRVLHADAEIRGHHIPKDTEVMLWLASAHRDPRVYDEPDRFDIEREHKSHLAFGGGAHFCLGAHLARLEAQLAIGTLVRRLPGLRLVSDEIEWGRSLFRVLGRLPVRFDPP
jgi:cytochrome P450